MSVEMTSGVLVAEMLEGMRFAFGPSMVVRKRCVDHIGGFQRLRDYYADDFMLGNLVWANGSAVVLSNHVVDHCVVNTRFTRSIAHQWDWMKSTRFSRPKGHLGAGLTFGAPFGLIALAAAMPLGKFWIGLDPFCLDSCGANGPIVISRQMPCAWHFSTRCVTCWDSYCGQPAT